MAAMVGARRGLLAARCSPRGALTAAPISSARRAGSPPSLPLRSLAPHRGAGSLTSERIYGDHHHELGTYNEGNYGESCSRYPTDRVNHQPQGDLPSAGSSTSFTGNRGVHIGGSVNASYSCSRERLYQTGGSYGLPNSRQPCNGPRVSNETPGNNAREPYRSGGAYNLQGPNRDLPNAPQQHIGTQAPYRSGSAYDVQSSNRDLPTAQQQHIGTRAPDRSGSAYNLQSPTRELPTAHQQHIGTQAPYRSDSGYSLQSPNGDIPNAHRQHIDSQASYGSGSTYNIQSHNGDILNPRQQHIGTQACNGHSGYGKLQAYDCPNGYDTYRAGYNNESNQQNFSFTGRQYGHGPSGQSYQKSTGNDQNRSVHAGGNASTHYGRNLEQPYQSGGSYGLPNSGQPYTGETSSETPGYNARQSYGSNTVFNHQSPDSNYANKLGNFASQYPNPSGFRMEQVAGFQQGRNGDFGYSISQATRVPYVTSKVDVQSNHPGYFSNVNVDVQLRPHGIDQGEHLDIQSTGTGRNNMNSTPYQDVPGSLRKDGSPFEISNEASGKSKGTVEELEKLCEDGKVKEALEVLALLQEKGILLHASEYFILLQACGDASALPEAREIHNKITQSQLITDIDVNNKILEMYVKCGSMEDAKKLFSNMPQHNLTSWNTMISGFVHNGLGEEATDFFDQFKQTGVKPDSGMFTYVFLACGILGSVDEGMLHFESMQKDFGITPSMEHYASIVNMLGQSGYIDEAREFTERMPVEPSIDVWESLMNMCRLHGFLELGERCAQIIGRLDPSRLNEQTKFGLFPVRDSDIAREKERKRANAIEGRSKVHEYRAGDRSHPEHLKIYEELRYLAAHMKEAGYIADTRFVLHDVDQETKEDALLAHSERLAVSYGLITSAARAPIRVIKNLRSCGDCHTALKIISKLVGRQIIARDAKRFHHFENGVCSCNDYW